jgi:hypothetical protein
MDDNGLRTAPFVPSSSLLMDEDEDMMDLGLFIARGRRTGTTGRGRRTPAAAAVLVGVGSPALAAERRRCSPR